MKRPSNDLHGLIKALNPAELRYLRGQMRAMDSQTRLVFEAIQAQKEYDEAELRAKLGEEMSANQLSVTKNYLYQFTLQHLVFRRQKQPAAWNVQTRLQFVEVLFHKGLYRQCWKWLRNLDKVTRELDHPILRYQVLEWKYRLFDRAYHKVETEKFEAQNRAWLENLAALQQLAQHQQKQQDFLFHLRNGSLLVAQSQVGEQFERWFEDPEFHADLPRRSQLAALSFAFTRGIYRFMKGKALEAIQDFEYACTQMESKPVWIKRFPEQYFDAKYRLGMIYLAMGNFEPVPEILQVISKAQTDSLFLSSRLFFYESNLERAWRTTVLAGKGLREAVKNAISAFPDHIGQFQDGERLAFRLNNGATLLMTGEVEAAARILKAALDDPGGRKFPEIVLGLRLILLLVYLELEDVDLFRYYHKAAYRFLYQRKGQFPLEEILIRQLSALLGTEGEERRKSWVELAEILKKARVEEARTIRYFDFEVWARSKARAVPFLVVWEEKVKAFLQAQEPATE